MKYLFCIFMILFLNLKLEAAIRVYLRSDYGKGEERTLRKLTTPLTDRVQALEHFNGIGEMGGRFDLFIKNESNMIRIYQCPTLKNCKDDLNNCIQDKKYWSCEKVFESNPENTCRYFKSGIKALKLTSFTIDEILSGVITAPIGILNHGVIEVVSNASEVVSSYQEIKNILNSNCDSIQEEENSETYIVEEPEKFFAGDILKVFDTKNYEENKSPIGSKTNSIHKTLEKEQF